MRKEINGVSVKFNHHILKSSPNKVVFQIEYHDELRLQKLVSLDLVNINVVDLGRKWIYAIKDISDENYKEYSKEYLETITDIHNRIVSFISKYVQFGDDIVLIDHYSRVYKMS
ncbi:hypothetical protein [Aquibacillus rhizosphaerae]|uniref:Uncharacterized protein n=1 Tax=Aquibacillus rhizosphaerae TaxID=3051431 RepID=A0ABT7L9G0_9BACI|nr:hypothetical protein [Aquibacillus sp. LR5S19]MDL4842483.1 hypothetical protein [Aquibacillus sp. LR5S19]